jgi:hypothetical protein
MKFSLYANLGGFAGLSIAMLSGCSTMANSEVAGRVSKEATVMGATAAKTATDLKAAGAKAIDEPKKDDKPSH